MNYYADKNILVIFGGRNDLNYKNSAPAYLNDVWLLMLDTLTWVEWQNPEGLHFVPESRYSHCAALLSESLAIFGGLGEDNYCKARVSALYWRHIKTVVKESSASGESREEGKEGERKVQEDSITLPMITQQDTGSKRVPAVNTRKDKIVKKIIR